MDENKLINNKDIQEKINVNELQKKLSRAFGCSDWDDLIKKSSPSFIEGAREFIAEKYFKSQPDTDIFFIDGRPYYNTLEL